MRSAGKISFKNLWAFSALLCMAHFLFFLFTPQEMNHFSEEWNREACVLGKSRVHLDGEGCRFYYTRDRVIALPYLSSPNNLVCANEPESLLFKEATILQKELRAGVCSDPIQKVWGDYSFQTPDIGFDAKGIWFARAATLYWLDNKNSEDDATSESTEKLAFGGKLSLMTGNREHRHYPNLVPYVYAKLMKLFHQAHPLGLQVVQFLLLGIVMLIFWTTRVRYQATKSFNNNSDAFWLWAGFAFVPIAAVFAFKLYSDLWLLAALIMLVWALDHRKLWLAVLCILLIPFIKTEGWVQLVALVATYHLLHGQRAPAWLWFFVIGSSLTYLLGVQAPLKDQTFYISFADRAAHPIESLKILGSILGYYLDVLFRPKLWGLLWPLSFYLLWKKRGELRWSVFPLIAVLLAIPLAFLAFPWGHKEVVLTGSNRALWTTLPMLWLLLREAWGKTSQYR